MISCGFHKVCQWVDLSLHHTSRIVSDHARFDQILQLFFYLLRNLLLFLVTTENATRILKTCIVALSIFSGRIMKLKEESDELFEMSFWIVQLYVQHFDISRCTRADLRVAWVLYSVICIGTHEPNFGIFDAVGELLLEIYTMKCSNRKYTVIVRT